MLITILRLLFCDKDETLLLNRLGSALKYARRHAATALADEADYKAALEDILAETDGIIQYLPEGEA